MLLRALAYGVLVGLCIFYLDTYVLDVRPEILHAFSIPVLAVVVGVAAALAMTHPVEGILMGVGAFVVLVVLQLLFGQADSPRFPHTVVFLAVHLAPLTVPATFGFTKTDRAPSRNGNT